MALAPGAVICDQAVSEQVRNTMVIYNFTLFIMLGLKNNGKGPGLVYLSASIINVPCLCKHYHTVLFVENLMLIATFHLPMYNHF